MGQPLAPKAAHTVLLAVTGMSPAVLTETVWALAHDAHAPIIPDRVVVLTTIAGRQSIERELLTPPGGDMPEMWQELRLAILGSENPPGDKLILEPPHVITAPNPRTGRMDWLEDLRTPAENEATADFLLAELRRWTETPDTRLVVSIAGGRKTMGALLHGCVSLLGRETDRLTHVLVNEPFDDPGLKPKFYFPRQRHQCLTATDGSQVLCDTARIDLADIPFVPLRNLFERDLVKKPATYTELVRRCRTAIGEMAKQNVRLELRRSRRIMRVNNCEIKLSSVQSTLMLFLAENAKEGKPCRGTFKDAVDPLRAFADMLRKQSVPEDGNDWRDEAGLPSDFDDQNIRKILDELRAKLRRCGAESLVPLLPQKGRFTLDLDPDRITLED